MKRELIEDINIERESKEGIDPKLEKPSNEVRDLYSEYSTEEYFDLKKEKAWKEKRRLLKGLVSEKIKSIKEEIKESDPESLTKGLEKIAMTKFLYLWQPGMCNHVRTIVEGKILDEGLVSPQFAERAGLEKIMPLWKPSESKGVHVYRGDSRYKLTKNIKEYLWGRHWGMIRGGRGVRYHEIYGPQPMGLVTDPILSSLQGGSEPVYTRVAPRFFLGTLVSWPEKESGLSDQDREKCESGLKELISETHNIYKNKPEQVIPIVSTHGDLLWPEHLNKWEVLSTVGDKKDKEYAKEKLNELKKKE